MVESLRWSQRVDDPAVLSGLIEGLYFVLPWLMNLSFADPPYVERVDGEVNGVPFRWELREWALGFETTTQEQQEERIAVACERLEILGKPERRRLLAALHYLHVACRLEREGRMAGEFVSEVLLNLAKVLEVLFPGGQSIESARAGLRCLGYDDPEIEARYIPVLALRNQVDVGHVHLAILTPEQLGVLHSFAYGAQ